MTGRKTEETFERDFPLASFLVDGGYVAARKHDDLVDEARRLAESYRRLLAHQRDGWDFAEHWKRRCMELSGLGDGRASRDAQDGTLRVCYLHDDLYPGGLHAEHEGDAGMDLRCVEGFVLGPHSTRFVPCGLRVQLPSGTFGALRPRSGLARRCGIDVVEGTVDEGFRGEIGVTMRNSSDACHVFADGDRIAQLVVVPYVACDVTEGITDEDTDRGADGYGSTGMS